MAEGKKETEMQEVLVNCWKIFTQAQSKPKPETETASSQLHSHSHSHSATSLGQKFPHPSVCEHLESAWQVKMKTKRKPLENVASSLSAFTSDVGK